MNESELRAILARNPQITAREEDRKELGITTREEDQSRFSERIERKLQEDICSLLRLREVVYIRPAMCKKSALPVGWPDFTFCYHGAPIALECKAGYNRCTDEQLEMHAKMRQNGWNVYEIRSLVEVKDILDQTRDK